MSSVPPESVRAKGNSPLVVLHKPGARVPIFCIHPAGGQVTAYLRLQSLLGDEQPLFAIQSRASESLEREQPTLEAMAIDYATVIQGVRPTGPYRLLGWSMGGFIAHAIARELELRGELVEQIAMIDSRPIAGFDTHDTGLAVMGVMHDLQLSPEPGSVLPELRKLNAKPLEGAGAPDVVSVARTHSQGCDLGRCLQQHRATLSEAFPAAARSPSWHRQFPDCCVVVRRLCARTLLVKLHQSRIEREGGWRYAFHDNSTAAYRCDRSGIVIDAGMQ